MTLNDLMEKYGTDKGTSEHNYAPIYADHFAFRRLHANRVLELGVWKGASLRVWREYFPYATVIGVDKVDRKIKIQGVEMVFSEQDDPELVEYLRDMYGSLDIIIDDASHISSKTISTFKNLWPLLNSGGIYVIEDLQTSYDPVNYGHTEAAVDPRQHPMVDGLTATQTAMQFCKALADEVNAGLYPEEYRLGYEVSKVTFGSNICFITKR